MAFALTFLSPFGCGEGRRLPSLQQSKISDDGEPADRLTTVELVRRIEPSLARVQAQFAPDPVNGNSPSETGYGTGIVFDRWGHIVTNDHVLRAPAGRRLPERIVVTAADGRSHWAVIAGRDRATDLAVLRIEAADLVPASFARAQDLRVGQEVLAFGYALDLGGGPTVTRGVVSAVHQSIYKEPYTIPEIIQTDAGINPGNSGGPLVNSAGEVVGINTAVVKQPGSPGFAISMALAEPVIQTLIRHGRVRRAFLGIGSVEGTPAAAQPMSSTVRQGVVVTLVSADSPAHRAGLRENDVVWKIGDRMIQSNGDLLSALAKYAPGESVTVSLFRESKPLTLKVILDHPPE